MAMNGIERLKELIEKYLKVNTIYYIPSKLTIIDKSFRPKQREIINATKSGRDVIALIPTGGGKSLTFQLSAVTEVG